LEMLKRKTSNAHHPHHPYNIQHTMGGGGTGEGNGGGEGGQGMPGNEHATKMALAKMKHKEAGRHGGRVPSGGRRSKPSPEFTYQPGFFPPLSPVPLPPAPYAHPQHHPHMQCQPMELPFQPHGGPRMATSSAHGGPTLPLKHGHASLPRNASGDTFSSTSTSDESSYAACGHPSPHHPQHSTHSQPQPQHSPDLQSHGWAKGRLGMDGTPRCTLPPSLPPPPCTPYATLSRPCPSPHESGARQPPQCALPPSQRPHITYQGLETPLPPSGRPRPLSSAGGAQGTEAYAPVPGPLSETGSGGHTTRENSLDDSVCSFHRGQGGARGGRGPRSEHVHPPHPSRPLYYVSAEVEGGSTTPPSFPPSQARGQGKISSLPRFLDQGVAGREGRGPSSPRFTMAVGRAQGPPSLLDARVSKGGKQGVALTPSLPASAGTYNHWAPGTRVVGSSPLPSSFPSSHPSSHGADGARALSSHPGAGVCKSHRGEREAGHLIQLPHAFRSTPASQRLYPPSAHHQGGRGKEEEESDGEDEEGSQSSLVSSLSSEDEFDSGDLCHDHRQGPCSQQQEALLKHAGHRQRPHHHHHHSHPRHGGEGGRFGKRAAQYGLGPIPRPQEARRKPRSSHSQTARPAAPEKPQDVSVDEEEAAMQMASFRLGRFWGGAMGGRGEGFKKTLEV
jgi:hypothetical protein